MRQPRNLIPRGVSHIITSRSRPLLIGSTLTWPYRLMMTRGQISFPFQVGSDSACFVIFKLIFRHIALGVVHLYMRLPNDRYENNFGYNRILGSYLIAVNVSTKTGEKKDLHPPCKWLHLLLNSVRIFALTSSGFPGTISIVFWHNKVLLLLFNYKYRFLGSSHSYNGST